MFALHASCFLLWRFDLSYQDFLPPSFPIHLETSTPPDNGLPKKLADTEKRKPAPIFPRPFFSSSPPSPPLSNSSPFNPARPTRGPDEPYAMSSSLPEVSPTRNNRAMQSRPLKRTRPLTPSDDDVFISGGLKKPRNDSPHLPLQPAQKPPGSNAPPPPFSPPSRFLAHYLS